MKRLITICAAIVLFATGYTIAGTWTTLDYPGATFVTCASGISGNSIVGEYDGGHGYHGFLYNMITQSYAPLDYPGANMTRASGISGNSIVGQYSDSSGSNHGFLYNGTSWTTLPIIPNGIDGSNVVGGNQLYNLTTGSLTMLNVPGSISGISGDSIVGYYNDGYFHSFLYNMITQSYAPLDYPGADYTLALGISDDCIVGEYFSEGSMIAHGFLYDGTSWTTFDHPEADVTEALGISDHSVVGYYLYNEGPRHGFIYTVPEPATLLLLGLGAVILRRKHEKRFCLFFIDLQQIKT